MSTKIADSRLPLRRRRTLFSWSWLVAALVLAILAFWGRSAAAQTERGSEIIERALQLEPDPKNGAALYREHCASCHGKQAHGDPAKVTPSLASQVTSYLIKQLADFAEGDRAAPEMHRTIARKSLSTPQAMRDLATYLSRLPPSASSETGDGEQLALGERIFRKTCAHCHGVQGEGNEQYASPSLQRQHYSYLLMQMRQLAVGHRYAVDIEVIELLEAMTLDQLTAVADFASRLPAAPPEPIAGSLRGSHAHPSPGALGERTGERNIRIGNSERTLARWASPRAIPVEDIQK